MTSARGPPKRELALQHLLDGADSEAALGAPPTYEEGKHFGDGVHHLYARTPRAECLAPKAATNIVVMPSHRTTAINERVDAATKEEPRADLTWIPHRPYACLPPVKCWDYCQLAPTNLQDWLQEQATIPAWVHYEHQWEPNYSPGLGLPLDWFAND